MTTELERDLLALAGTLRASTVAVHTGRGAGSGSGVIWSADGTIVTNAHVARTARVEVDLPDGRRVPGAVERRDDRRDLACIRIAADRLTSARYRDPGDLRVGEFVAAFGHPLGVRDVLSTGIVFARHRAGGDRFVRADVKLAPGNSGGALADAAGRVVGINSMVAGGLALAIPADAVAQFMGGSAAAPRLGVRLAAIRVASRAALAVLATEPGSAAERSGIIAGDIILAPDLGRLGTARSLDILRGGSALSVAIVRPAEEAAAAA
jgi:serine protease Do